MPFTPSVLSRFVEPLLLLSFLTLSACDKCAGLEGEKLEECKGSSEDDSGGGRASSNPSSTAGSSPEVPSNDTCNNLPSCCEELGVVDDAVRFEGVVSGGAALDSTDFFCFTVPALSTITLGVNRTADLGGPDIKLYEYAKSVSPADVIATTRESTAWDLLGGAYALQVSSDSLGLGLGYEVQLTRTGLEFEEPDDEPGSTTDEAEILHLELDELVRAEGYVGAQDESDLYDVRVPSDMRLGLQLLHVGGSGTVSVRAVRYVAAPSFGENLLSAAAGKPQTTLMTPLPEGRWLLQVSGTGAYRLGLGLQTAVSP